MKLPKGKTWSKDANHFTDREYVYSKISLFDNAPDLHIKFTPSRGLNGFLEYSHERKRAVWYTYKQTALYLTIRKYSELRAYQVLNDIGLSPSGEDFGRHFTEAILTFWNEKGLPLR